MAVRWQHGRRSIVRSHYLPAGSDCQAGAVARPRVLLAASRAIARDAIVEYTLASKGSAATFAAMEGSASDAPAQQPACRPPWAQSSLTPASPRDGPAVCRDDTGPSAAERKRRPPSGQAQAARPEISEDPDVGSGTPSLNCWESRANVGAAPFETNRELTVRLGGDGDRPGLQQLAQHGP